LDALIGGMGGGTSALLGCSLLEVFYEGSTENDYIKGDR
jgi:hypothetical protein